MIGLPLISSTKSGTSARVAQSEREIGGGGMLSEDTWLHDGKRVAADIRTSPSFWVDCQQVYDNECWREAYFNISDLYEHSLAVDSTRVWLGSAQTWSFLHSARNLPWHSCPADERDEVWCQWTHLLFFPPGLLAVLSAQPGFLAIWGIVSVSFKVYLSNGLQRNCSSHLCGCPS